MDRKELERIASTISQESATVDTDAKADARASATVTEDMAHVDMEANANVNLNVDGDADAGADAGAHTAYKDIPIPTGSSSWMDRISSFVSATLSYFSEHIHLFIILIFKVVLGAFAWLLSWECNQMLPLLVRLGLSLVAAVFSELYIIYYSVWYTAMGNKCY